MMFPILRKKQEQEEAKPFVVDYVITANGWRSSGGIKCNHEDDKKFWQLLEMVVSDILKGDRGPMNSVLNESYTDGFSRYRRSVERNKTTWRWEEIDYHSSEQPTKEEN